MQSIKILIIEDDNISQLMLKTMLAEYELTLVDSGEAGLEAANDNHDLIILDINLPGIDGYETCRTLREAEATATIPIIFLTSYTGIEDRLQAYGVGGNDYISKPFDVTELLTKIKFHSQTVVKQQQHDQEQNSTFHLLMEVQTSAAKIQSISRFIQTTLFCHDIDSLFKHFFKTASEIGLECILKIESTNGSETRSSSDGISRLEQEIIDMSGNMDRIHTFGQDRAIYRWNHATLLTRKVGDMIDTLAIFMDALEAGIKAVESETKLLKKVEQLESNNSAVRDKVTDLFGMMNNELKDTILSLSLISALDVEDEDRLNDLLDGFQKQIDVELNKLNENNEVMQQLISDLRTPPPELQALMEDEPEDDGVMLF